MSYEEIKKLAKITIVPEALESEMINHGFTERQVHDVFIALGWAQVTKVKRKEKEEAERKADFQMFKRMLFQIRDGAITEESYLYFLAGYFGVIPTSEDLTIPEKGSFKLE